MLLYYITDRKQFPGGELERRERLLEKIAEAARCGVDYVQLREKDLPSRDLETLAREAMERIRASGGKTRLLINSRTDVALAAGADGVHLRSRDISPEEVRKIWRAGNEVDATDCGRFVSHGGGSDGRGKIWCGFCCVRPGVRKERRSGNGCDGFGFAADGLPERNPSLRTRRRYIENAALCAEAGAKGVAGIRLFQESEFAEVVAKLR